jgi:hypothetical protein
MRADTVHTLIGAYVLDAIDDVERAAVERHLDRCDVCVTEARELRETTTQLADPTATAPPPELRDRVLGAISQIRQTGPRAARPTQGTLARWRRGTAVAVAACLLAVGGGFAAWSLQQERVARERANAEAAADRADAARKRAEAADKRADAATKRAAEIAAVLAEPDALTRTAKVTGGGRVRVVVSAELDRAVVLMSDLGRTPAGKTYQLWLIKGAQPRSAGVLPTGAQEATRLLRGLGDADVLGVTVEPAGGSEQPTTTPIAAVELH